MRSRTRTRGSVTAGRTFHQWFVSDSWLPRGPEGQKLEKRIAHDFPLSTCEQDLTVFKSLNAGAESGYCWWTVEFWAPTVHPLGKDAVASHARRRMRNLLSTRVIGCETGSAENCHWNICIFIFLQSWQSLFLQTNLVFFLKYFLWANLFFCCFKGQVLFVVLFQRKLAFQTQYSCFIFKHVVPKGLDHTLSVITISLCMCVCVCTSGPNWGGGMDHFGFRLVSDHSWPFLEKWSQPPAPWKWS